MKLGIERLIGLGIGFGGNNAQFGMSVLPVSGYTLPLQYPRLGFDYFIIDGLSLGGNLGISFLTNRCTPIPKKIALIPYMAFSPNEN